MVVSAPLHAGIQLPPTNEVWAKVMFLHLSVSHSGHGGGGVVVSAPLHAWIHSHGNTP